MAGTQVHCCHISISLDSILVPCVVFPSLSYTNMYIPYCFCCGSLPTKYGNLQCLHSFALPSFVHVSLSISELYVNLYIPIVLVVARQGYRDQIVTMLHSVMWVCLCIPGHIHCSCSTVMALLCIPLSELVSFAFSTIPICPFLIQRFTCVNRSPNDC